MLNKKLGADFDFRVFNCVDFLSFLKSFCETNLEIEKVKDDFVIFSKDMKLGKFY